MLRPALVLLLGAMLLAGCNRGRGRVLEIGYVSAPQVNLRDRVAAAYNKVGLLKNGDRVEVIDRDRRFAKVRAANGIEGWMEQRYLVSQAVFDKLQKLTADNQNDPVQGEATTRNDTNLHVEPGRDSDHLYQISTGEKVQLLKRAVAEKPGTVAPAHPAKSGEGKAGKKTEKRPAAQSSDKDKTDNVESRIAATPAAVLEDWWLVRDTRNRVGWVLGRMIDLDLPLEIAQYAEGQRIVAYFVLNQVRDADKQVAQYLTVLTEPKDGLPFDFNQVRVFTWNVKRHRYETAYRERLKGVLPVIVTQENYEKEGTLPTFTVRVQDNSGAISERKYKLNTPIVRRVLGAGEERSKSHR